MSKTRIPISEAQIDRRIEFLIKEAKSGDYENRFPDQTIKYALRVITNYFSVGDDVSSRKHRKDCPYRSEKAHKLSQTDPTGWLDKVTNEHQYPIKRAWAWLLKQRELLTVPLIKEHLRKWPIVVVTKDENASLHDDTEMEPYQRYAAKGIKVLKRNLSGIWEPVSVNQISN
jgi:hypothetical protein